MKNDNLNKAFEERYNSYSLPDESAIRALSGQNPPRRKRIRPGRRAFTAIAAAILALAMLTSAAYAIVPEFREFLNLGGKYSPPDAVEIRTPAELDAVRNDLNANYILMNDITFTDADYASGGLFEGGFTPIGSYTDGEQAATGGVFTGIFDGNGHTIYNLKLKQCGYMGLFGAAGSGDGNVYEVGGIIMRLRIEGGEALAGSDTVCVGALCGSGNYVIECAVSDFVVVGNDVSRTGGIAGSASIIDSCFSSANVSGGKTTGSIAGSSRTVVTSYALNGGDICGSYICVPQLLTSGRFDEIYARLSASKRDADMFASYYSSRDSVDGSALNSIRISDYCYVNAGELGTDVMRLEPFISELELEKLDLALKSVFDEAELTSALFGDGIKAGCVYSYSGDEKEFYGFDFDSVWERKNGALSLKAFG